MQLKGRLRHADASYEMKHQTLLSAKNPIVRKFIEDAHESNYHEGTEYVHSILHQKYWIIGLRNALRNVKMECVKCRKHQVGGVQPFRADLPKERLEESAFPFANTGVDYFGPFQSEMHEEINETLVLSIHMFDNKSCACWSRAQLGSRRLSCCYNEIIARRGKPNIILSNNETSFVGAAREMREWERMVRSCMNTMMAIVGNKTLTDDVQPYVLLSRH